MLGYTIQNNSGYYSANNKPPKMVLMHLKDSLTALELCKIKRSGWVPVQVDPIAPFLSNGPPQDRFRHMYTKLWAWNMVHFRSIIFLDTDMLVKGSLRNLFELVAHIPSLEFAASGDVWADRFDTLFNAGFFVVRPSRKVFHEFIGTKGAHLDYDGSIVCLTRSCRAEFPKCILQVSAHPAAQNLRHESRDGMELRRWNQRAP